MRLDKFLSGMGAGTRTEIKKAVKAGLVTVDGAVAKDPGMQVSEDSAVTFRSEPVVYEEFVYYMMNKPAGVISASDDSREETVVDLIAEQKRKDLFPAGRLDRDTEGLLLITNDGGLAHRLLSPKHHVDKKYYAVVSGAVTDEDVQAFEDGLVLTDGLECLPAKLEILRAGATSEVEVVIQEGKFHQIKRMFAARGMEVLYLKRLTMGPLILDDTLEPGEYRRLTEKELQSLKEL
jgi:16S rRNA pseudouridine516 synthase